MLQFINLYNETINPFFINPKIENLPFNYRSHKSIVEFNNNFFKHLSSFAFSKNEYEKLYNQSKQNTFIEDQGFVNITFLDLVNKESPDEIYPQKVLETINDCKKNVPNLRVHHR